METREGLRNEPKPIIKTKFGEPFNLKAVSASILRQMQSERVARIEPESQDIFPIASLELQIEGFGKGCIDFYRGIHAIKSLFITKSFLKDIDTPAGPIEGNFIIASNCDVPQQRTINFPFFKFTPNFQNIDQAQIQNLPIIEFDYGTRRYKGLPHVDLVDKKIFYGWVPDKLRNSRVVMLPMKQDVLDNIVFTVRKK